MLWGSEFGDNMWVEMYICMTLVLTLFFTEYCFYVLQMPMDCNYMYWAIMDYSNMVQESSFVHLVNTISMFHHLAINERENGNIYEMSHKVSLT
jgi:hypothetical protein